MQTREMPHGGSEAPLPVNILLVDDTPAKLLTYEVILAELGENLIKAGSVAGAFEVLLKMDVALVVADVSMPGVDGFEFATQLRGHPRFEAMPVIFVTAAAYSEPDMLQGYESGAVDFVTAPIVPDRKQRELEALRLGLEERVAARTAELAASEVRYRTLVDNANDIVATLDLSFNFTSVNPAIERLLGYTPEEIVGSHLSKFVPPDQLAMHAAMRTRKLEGEASTQYEMQLLAKGWRAAVHARSQFQAHVR